MHRQLLLAASTFLVLFAVLISSRLPFLSDLLVGEEGSFAALVADPVKPSDVTSNHFPQGLIAKVDGERIYAPFERNIVLYLLIEEGPGNLLRKLNTLSLESSETTKLIRAAYFGLFLIGVLPMLAWASWLAVRSRYALLSMAVLIFGLTTPLVIGASIQPQIDGSIGVTLLGLAAFLLVSARSANVWRFVCAGTLVGLGRPEWPMAFGAAGLTVLLLCLVVGSRSWRQCLTLIAGLGLGTALSVQASPPDYAMGFGVMNRIYAVRNDRLQLLWHELGLLWPVLALLILTLVLIAAHLKSRLDQNPGAVITGFSAAVITTGFAISGWPGDGFPRYYAPAFVLSCFAAVALILQESKLASSHPAGFIPPNFAESAILVLCFCLGINLVDLARAKAANVSITSLYGARLDLIRSEMSSIANKAAKTPTAIFFTHASIWIYEPGVNFVSQDMGWEGAKDYLAKTRPGLEVRLSRP